jgi:CheY-like chemotaxis protein
MSEARKSALIAEDDEALRRMMITLLRPFDLEIDEARDGLEAVQRLRDHPYDVVIVDLMMPRADGYAVIRYLEEMQPQMRAIVTSAARGEELRAIARSSVVRGVISKPFDITAFSNRVRECITSPRRPPSASATTDGSDVPGAILPS